MNKLYPQFSIKGVVPLVTFVSSKLAILDYTAILTMRTEGRREKDEERKDYRRRGSSKSESGVSALRKEGARPDAMIVAASPPRRVQRKKEVDDDLFKTS